MYEGWKEGGKSRETHVKERVARPMEWKDIIMNTEDVSDWGSITIGHKMPDLP